MNEDILAGTGSADRTVDGSNQDQNFRRAAWGWLFTAVLIGLIVVLLGVFEPPWWNRLMDAFGMRLDQLSMAAESFLRRWCGIPVGFPN